MFWLRIHHTLYLFSYMFDILFHFLFGVFILFHFSFGIRLFRVTGFAFHLWLLQKFRQVQHPTKFPTFLFHVRQYVPQPRRNEETRTEEAQKEFGGVLIYEE